MDITWAMLLVIAGIISVIYASSARKESARKFTWIGVIVTGIAVLAIMNLVPQLSLLNQNIGLGGTGTTTTTTTTPGLAVTTYSPTGSLATIDKYASSTTVSGTNYVKVGDNPATSSAATPNLNKGDKITYWLQNGTTANYYTSPVTKVQDDGVTYYTAQAWNNGTATITVYDLVGKVAVGNSASNISMAANKQANIEITYQGTAKKSAGPFGGVLIVEYNNTFSTVTCTGADLLSSNPYQVTYTPAIAANTYKAYAYASTLDDGSGAVRTIDCQFQNGGTSNAGAQYYINFLPASYYVSQDGRILLDVEKAADAVTTRVLQINTIKPTGSLFWGA